MYGPYVSIFGIVFAAGGFFFVVRVALKQLTVDLNGLEKRLTFDLNGIGRKMTELKETAARDEFRSAVMLLAFCPEKERKKIAEYLLGGK